MGLAIVCGIQAHNLHGASVVGGWGDRRIIIVGVAGVNLGLVDRRSATRGGLITKDRWPAVLTNHFYAPADTVSAGTIPRATTGCTTRSRQVRRQSSD